MSSGAAPPQPPVKIPSHLRHGSSYVYRRYRCRCRRCQTWRRRYDREVYAAKRRKNPGGWYACLGSWGVTHAEHEYDHAGTCVRCGANRTTEEFWERKWQGT